MSIYLIVDNFYTFAEFSTTDIEIYGETLEHILKQWEVTKGETKGRRYWLNEGGGGIRWIKRVKRVREEAQAVIRNKFGHILFSLSI